MRASLTLAMEAPPLERVRADLAVALIFRDERPLRGDVGRVDWRLLGLLSRLIRAGRLSGADGEALLAPTFGRLRAPRVLVLGAGVRGQLQPLRVEQAIREAVLRGLQLGCRSLAFTPPAADAGVAEALVRGAVTALRQVPAELRLLLVLGAGAADRLRAAASAAPRSGVQVRLQTRAPQAGAARPAAPRPPRLRAAASPWQDGS